MKKDCSTCEFNFGGTCASHGGVYQYGDEIADDTTCCDGWSEGFEYFQHKITTAPRFLRDPHNDYRISYQEFSKLFDDYNAGIPVTINIFDAVKYVYGISMVDIAVVLGVTYGVVYRAKTQGIVKKRITQFANALCVPEKFLLNVNTGDFKELTRCRDAFFLNQTLTNFLHLCQIGKINLLKKSVRFTFIARFMLQKYCQELTIFIGTRGFLWMSILKVSVLL